MMPFWIQGRVEVTTDDPDASDAIWQAVIDLGVLIDTPDEFSAQMFGLSKDARSDRSLRQNSSLADRGLPTVLSVGLANELNRHEQFVENHGSGEIGGYTYASLAEVRTKMSQNVSLENSDWKLVLDMAELVVRSGRHRAEQVRFVVWYNW